MKKSLGELEQQRSALQLFMNTHNQTISIHKDLESMGFGLKELTFLYDTITEIAFENDIPVGKAIKKFLSDVEEQYNRKLGFEERLQNLKSEINGLRKERTQLRTEILLNPMIGPKLIKLTQIGASDQTIINIAKLFEKYGVSGEDNTDGQMLLSDLNKYDGLKAALIALTKKVEALRKDVSFLETQKRDLEKDNKMILSSFTYLRRTIDFLEGTLFSMRNEILSLGLINIFISYLLRNQFHNNNSNSNQQHQPYQPDEFTALSRSINGEDIPIKEVKKALAKAILVLLNRIGQDNFTLAAGLLTAYDALVE